VIANGELVKNIGSLLSSRLPSKFSKTPSVLLRIEYWLAERTEPDPKVSRHFKEMFSYYLKFYVVTDGKRIS
jgi:hypothetical protein